MGRTSNAKIQLLGVAFDLIWNNSYGAVSVEQICAKASVSKGSFYHFFPSKSDLAVAAFNCFWQEKQPFFDAVFAPTISPLDRLDRYCGLIYDFQKDYQDRTGLVLGCPFAALGSELSNRDDKIRKLTQDMVERFCAYIESALADLAAGGCRLPAPASELARAIYSYVWGMMLQAKVRNDLEVLLHMPRIVRLMVGAQPQVCAA